MPESSPSDASSSLPPPSEGTVSAIGPAASQAYLPSKQSRVVQVLLLVSVVVVAFLAWECRSDLSLSTRSGLGFLCFLGLVASFSQALPRVRWQTLFWGITLQFLLAYAVINVALVREFFEVLGRGITLMIASSDAGAKFVFGDLAAVNGKVGFVFAFKVLPPIIFISAFFSILYYYGILQFIVRLFARLMMFFLRTSGAETLSVTANVFMGQTEAPLIVKPFIKRMTPSEMLTLMASGMATISGGMIALYLSMKADPVSILCTSVMACPCSLYLSKLLLPETQRPETLGTAPIYVEANHVNVIDAFAAGIKDGLWLALNVAAMLIGFLALIALINLLLAGSKTQLIHFHDWLGLSADYLAFWPDDLSLEKLFGALFAPMAFLMGIPEADIPRVGSLLGIKLVANEAAAYNIFSSEAFSDLSQRSKLLTVYALTGFANISSIGIQLGGIGALAPERRSDLARLGLKALFIGFMVTVINACVAGIFLPE